MLRRPIVDFYSNKNILITGGTGFIGIAVVEKLLRSFPQINKIYLIVRDKQGQSVEKRCSDFFNNKVFRNLKHIPREKIDFISGDLSKEFLGLSDEVVHKIQDDIHVIVHSGASTNFFAPLGGLIKTNIQATRDLLNIAKDCPKLESFMHVSSAYVHSNKQNTIKEEIYTHSITSRELIELSTKYNDEKMKKIGREVLKTWSNRYSYTKSIAEDLLPDYRQYFSVGIFRPSIVMPAWKEPYPYWFQNMMGFPKLIFEMRNGFNVVVNPNVSPSIVPIDVTVNALLAATCEVSSKKYNLKIYNSTNYTNPCKEKDIAKYYTKGIGIRSLLFENFKFKLLSRYNDFVLGLQSREKTYVNEIVKIEKTKASLFYYLDTHFSWETKKLEKLWGGMSEEEKRLLFFDVNQVDWKCYYENMHKALKVDFM